MAGLLYRLGRWCFVRRRLVLAGWLLALVAAGAAAGALKGSTSDAFSVPGTESQRALDLLREGFGPGFNGPLTVVIDATAINIDTSGKLASVLPVYLVLVVGLALLLLLVVFRSLLVPVTAVAGFLLTIAATRSGSSSSSSSRGTSGACSACRARHP